MEWKTIKFLQNIFKNIFKCYEKKFQDSPKQNSPYHLNTIIFLVRNARYLLIEKRIQK